MRRGSRPFPEISIRGLTSFGRSASGRTAARLDSPTPRVAGINGGRFAPGIATGGRVDWVLQLTLRGVRGAWYHKRISLFLSVLLHQA